MLTNLNFKVLSGQLNCTSKCYLVNQFELQSPIWSAYLKLQVSSSVISREVDERNEFLDRHRPMLSSADDR